MASRLDQLVGGILILISVFVFVYYTVWAFVVPFLPESRLLHLLFLPHDYAIKIPLALIAIAFLFVTLFIARTLQKQNKKKKKA